jgi:hypothetical protein
MTPLPCTLENRTSKVAKAKTSIPHLRCWLIFPRSLGLLLRTLMLLPSWTTLPLPPSKDMLHPMSSLALWSSH